MWRLLWSLFLLQSDEVLLKELQALAQPAPADDGTLRALVDQTLPQVAKVMHSRVPRALSTKVVSRSEASRKLRAVLEREYPSHRLARLGDALKAVKNIQVLHPESPPQPYP